MDSIQYKEARKKAKDIAKRLRATDPRLDGSVSVSHDDGSFFLFRNAFAQRIADSDWFMVFTEHHGFHIFHESDAELSQLGGDRVVAPPAEEPTIPIPGSSRECSVCGSGDRIYYARKEEHGEYVYLWMTVKYKMSETVAQIQGILDSSDRPICICGDCGHLDRFIDPAEVASKASGDR